MAYQVESFERENWLTLFEELIANGDFGAKQLYAWFQEERDLIEQSILELQYLEETRDD